MDFEEEVQALQQDEDKDHEVENTNEEKAEGEISNPDSEVND